MIVYRLNKHFTQVKSNCFSVDFFFLLFFARVDDGLSISYKICFQLGEHGTEHSFADTFQVSLGLFLLFSIAHTFFSQIWHSTDTQYGMNIEQYLIII